MLKLLLWTWEHGQTSGQIWKNTTFANLALAIFFKTATTYDNFIKKVSTFDAC